MTTALGLLAIAALVFAQGFFVAGEFAFVAARRARLDELAAAGDRRGRRAVAVAQQLSFMLSGAQFGITATSLAVGFLAEPTLGRVLEPVLGSVGVPDSATRGVSLGVGFVIATVAQMVLGELGPKNLAIAVPDEVALSLARPMLLFLRLARPVIRLFDGSANALLRAVGIEPQEEILVAVSAGELQRIIQNSGKEGALTPGQAVLLSRALEFRTLRVADVMVPRPSIVSVAATASCEDLRRLAVLTGHSRFPVVGDQGLDDVVGVVQAKAVLGVPVTSRPTTRVGVLARPPLVVPETALLGRVLAELRAARTPLALVVDEFGGTAGIVTLEDVVEELVGEILDEYDAAEPELQLWPDGSWSVPGASRIDQAQRATGLDLPEGDYDTMGGLVMALLQRVPVVGDEVVVGGVRIAVERMADHAVAWVRLSSVPL